jgi:hypothetical protein
MKYALDVTSLSTTIVDFKYVVRIQCQENLGMNDDGGWPPLGLWFGSEKEIEKLLKMNLCFCIQIAKA